MMSDFTNTLNYFKAYSLDKDPFDLSHSGSVYFTTPEIEHRLELIPHLAVFSDRIVQIVGEEGIGKTSLFYQLQTLMADNDPIALSANGEESAMDMIRTLAEALKLTQISSSSQDELLYQLTASVERAQDSGKAIVLLVDNVEKLSIECLQLLFQLASHEQQKQSLHLILFTSLDLEKMIQHPALSLIHTIELSGFRAEQVKPYLDYRLQQADYLGEILFSDKQVNDFYKTSNGNPGIINQLAIQALSDPARIEQAPQKNRSWLAFMLNPVWSYGVSILVVLLSVAYVLMTDKEETVEAIQVSIPEATDKSLAVKQKTNELLMPDPTETSEPDEEQQNAVEVFPAVEENKPAEMATEEADENSSAQTAVTELREEPVSEAKEIQAEPQETTREVSSSTEDEVTETIDSPVSETPPTDTSQALVTSLAGIKGADWLQQQAARNYVLQLIGVHDPTILTSIINTHPDLKGQLSRFATLNSGKPWYVLVYGNYTDRGQAISDIPTLPASIRKLKPWPRTMASIHTALKTSIH